MSGSPSPSLRSLYRRLGTHRIIRRGIARRSAFTRMKERGTRTPETATTEECSSPATRGAAWADEYGRIWQRRVNSSTEHGWSISATDTHGLSGEPRERAD